MPYSLSHFLSVSSAVLSRERKALVKKKVLLVERIVCVKILLGSMSKVDGTKPLYVGHVFIGLTDID